MRGACAVSQQRTEDGGGVRAEALLRGREGDGGRRRGERGGRGGLEMKGGGTLNGRGFGREVGALQGEESRDARDSSFFPSSGRSRVSLVLSGQSSNVDPKARPRRGPWLGLCSSSV